ncbi:glutamyl-tRNA reductase [Levilactobacillus brevis]|uniref:Glutamyl-tRNA reductase n=1 Tax=Levilactobacillus brevis TaxID=1580 RepID=A0A2A3TWH4_LEVBR|nr:glutamyl-tRNA reductase [Levilactobacillus brevis]PBQ22986.1 glutamyl-tRNA reductase [Levilactobacillus brevis]
MYMMCVSLNYHQVPAELREQFTFSKEVLSKANQELNQEKSILENVILATCNRTEIYAVVDQIHTGRYYIKRFIARWFHVTVEMLNEYAVVNVQDTTVKQLLRVSAGLDSLIKGEPQILGQVKTAFATAQQQGTTGVMLNQLFRQAITFAKKMHTQYRSSEFAQTSSQAGLHQIKVQLGTLKGKKLTVVGVGEIGSQVVKNAGTMGFSKITVVNRHLDKAQALVAAANTNTVTSAPWSRLKMTLRDSDAAILATAAPEPVIHTAELTAKPSTKNLVVIDLGMPRNVKIDEETTVIDYYDIDHLSAIVSANEQRKQHMFTQMEAAIPSEIDSFFTWQQQLHIVPVIRALREHALQVESVSYDGLLRQLPELDAHERKVISKHMKGIINQMIKGPIKEIKELSVDSTALAYIDFFCRIFGLNLSDVGGPRAHEG